MWKFSQWFQKAHSFHEINGLTCQEALRFKGLCLCCLMIFAVMYDHTFSKLADNLIRHQVKLIHNMGCQPGDCIWSL